MLYSRTAEPAPRQIRLRLRALLQLLEEEASCISVHISYPPAAHAARSAFLLHRNPRTRRKKTHRLGIAEIFYPHYKGYNVSARTAAEAMKKAFFGSYMKGRRFLAVKRAQSGISAARTLQRYIR